MSAPSDNAIPPVPLDGSSDHDPETVVNDAARSSDEHESLTDAAGVHDDVEVLDDASAADPRTGDGVGDADHHEQIVVEPTFETPDEGAGPAPRGPYDPSPFADADADVDDVVVAASADAPAEAEAPDDGDAPEGDDVLQDVGSVDDDSTGVERADSSEPAESTEPADDAEPVDDAEPADDAESGDDAEPAQTADPVDSTALADTTSPAEHTDADQIEDLFDRDAAANALPGSHESADATDDFAEDEVDEETRVRDQIEWTASGPVGGAPVSGADAVAPNAAVADPTFTAAAGFPAATAPAGHPRPDQAVPSNAVPGHAQPGHAHPGAGLPGAGLRGAGLPGAGLPVTGLPGQAPTASQHAPLAASPYAPQAPQFAPPGGVLQPAPHSAADVAPPVHGAPVAPGPVAPGSGVPGPVALANELAQTAPRVDPRAAAKAASTLDLSAPALDVEGLSKRFGEKVAVNDISFSVQAGQFFGIVGPNGAGKTTTLSMATGLLKPGTGHVRVHGIDVWAHPGPAQHLMGVLPDRLRLFDRLTGAQMLLHAGLLRGMPKQLVEQRANDLIQAFGLTEAAGRLVADYSAGMTKKIALASAMIHAPRLLVLDEPFESVDPVSSANLIEILENYVSKGGSVVLSSHSMDLVERTCDHVGIIVQGRMLALGSLDEVREGGTLEDRFIDLAGGRRGVQGIDWLNSFQS